MRSRFVSLLVVFLVVSQPFVVAAQQVAQNVAVPDVLNSGVDSGDVFVNDAGGVSAGSVAGGVSSADSGIGVASTSANVLGVVSPSLSA